MDAYQPRYQAPRKKRRRRRRGRSYRGICNVLLLLLASALFITAGKMFAGGVQNNTPAGSGDKTPPQIAGVHDFTVYEGDTVTYRDGITVTDDTDEDPKLTVDAAEVNLSRAGTYPVTYTAQDAAGNAASETASVTVLAKREGYADLDTIFAAVDQKLTAILSRDDEPLQQVKAIYSWARTGLSYSGHTDKSDLYQAAYSMLTGGRGDCYGYYAVTKLMFDRLGIPNIDVRKVKTSADDSDHYWSLVSVDGGETYYHFDATPRVGDGDNFCLVTDAFLDAYSNANKGSHNRDKSLYPATPEEPLT